MTAAPMRIVEETLRLDACAPEDVIDVSYSIHGSWRSIGRVVLKRIKPLAKGRVQIKYHDTPAGSKVQKIDLDAGLMVKRRRKPVEADGPGAGTIEPQTARVDGVGYVSTDPAVDIAVSIARAVSERLPNPPWDRNAALHPAMQDRAVRGGQGLGPDLLAMIEAQDARTVAVVDLLSDSLLWRG